MKIVALITWSVKTYLEVQQMFLINWKLTVNHLHVLLTCFFVVISYNLYDLNQQRLIETTSDAKI